MSKDLTEEQKALICEWLDKREDSILSIKYFKKSYNLNPKPKLELNRWIKDDDYPNWIAFTTSDKHYGIDIDGEWFEDDAPYISDGQDRYATDEEITKALTKEAVKRGFVNGARFVSEFSDFNSIRKITPHISHNTKCTWKYENQINALRSDNGLDSSTGCSNPLIFKNGKWAEIVPSNHKEIEDIEATIKQLQEQVNELKK